MKIEDRVREELEEGRGPELDASDEAWERIRRRIGRRRGVPERWGALAVGVAVAAIGVGLAGWMLVAASGGRQSAANNPSPRATPSGQPSAAPLRDMRYETNAIVLQQGRGPVMLCLGAIQLSLPPRCGTLPIANWSWDRVNGEHRASGVTWGAYQLLGTFDGAAFHVIRVGAPQPARQDPSDRIEIPCPQPPGGWVASDPSRTRESDRSAAGALVDRQPDSAGWWVKVIHRPVGTDVYGPSDVVLNAAFTGDIERHQTELARVWGGPLCVVRYERTDAELRGIQSELTSSVAKKYGMRLLSAYVDVVRNRVVVDVVIFDEELKAALDGRYGKGAVWLTAELRPVG